MVLKSDYFRIEILKLALWIARRNSAKIRLF